MKTVSVICPTLNEEHYIKQTIESFLSQQHDNFEIEILIIDGGSSDGTRDIVKKFAGTDYGIKLIDNPKRKTPYAFNIGLTAAKGEYIALLGAHTKYDSNYIQACLEELEASGSVGCTGRVITRSAFDRFGSKVSEWVMLSTFGVSRLSFRTMKEGYTFSVNFPVFKKQPLLDLGGYNVTLERNQDNDMNQRLLNAGHKLYCTWKTKCYYHPPATLNKLFKHAYRTGFWNAISLKGHPESMRIHHITPFVFSVTLVALAILGCLESIFLNTFWCWYLMIGVVAVHILAGILASIRSYMYSSDLRKLCLPFIFFLFHFIYGWGTINGFVRGKTNAK